MSSVCQFYTDVLTVNTQQLLLSKEAAKRMYALSGILPDGPERAQGDAVGQHGQQVDSEEQYIQHVSHLQPLLCNVSTRLSLLQVLPDERDFMQDVVHDWRSAFPNGNSHNEISVHVSGAVIVVVVTTC